MSEDTYYQHVDFTPLKKESNKKLEISSMNNCGDFPLHSN
jgi:hypothetical protein